VLEDFRLDIVPDLLKPGWSVCSYDCLVVLAERLRDTVDSELERGIEDV
jgi:hypothetical protein